MSATARQMKELVQVAREAVSDFEEDDADLRRIAFERILDHMLSGDGPFIMFGQNGAAITSEPEDDANFRSVAFGRVRDRMLSGDGPFIMFGQDGAATTSEPEDDWPPKTELRRTDLVSGYFGIDEEKAVDLFDLSGRDPALRLSPEQVPGKKADAIRLITLLVAGARAALGLDTTTAHIRSMLEGQDALDADNFAATLAAMEEIILFGEPGQRNRVVRLKAIGVAEAKERAARLVS